jgi:hypothetical protein
MNSFDFSNDAGKVGFEESRIDLAWFAMEWKERLEGKHRTATSGAVNLILNIPIWKPKKQHATVLYKLIGFRFVLKLLMQMCVFGIQSVIVFCKPLVFVFEMCQLIAEQKESLAKYGGTSGFGDERLNSRKDGDAHESSFPDSSIERLR